MLDQAQLIEIETGRVVVANVIVARSIAQRTRGLIGKRKLPPDSGLWLEPCNGIHTFGMRFAIDVVAFDAAGTVLKMWEAVRPFRICLPVTRGRTVLELPAGSFAQLNLQGDKHYQLGHPKNKSKQS